MDTFNETTSLGAIKAAIKSGNQSLARQLLRSEIQQNPSAEAWYLVSLVCTSREQQINALERAIGIDPFHEKANQALRQAKEPAQSTRLYDNYTKSPVQSREQNSKLLQDTAMIFTEYDWNIKFYTDDMIQVEKKKPVNAFAAALVILFFNLLGALLVCAGIATASKKVITLKATSNRKIELSDSDGKRMQISGANEVIPIAKSLNGGATYAQAILLGIAVFIIVYIILLSSAEPSYYYY